MRSTADVVARLEELVAALRDEVAASRVTLRLDGAERGFDVDDVVAEARGAGVKSLRGERSINQRASPTVVWMGRERRLLVQNDLRGATPPAPAALTEVYGTTAQMLGPIVRDDGLVGWISVHHNGGPREWRASDVAAVERAVAAVQDELDRAGAAAS